MLDYDVTGTLPRAEGLRPFGTIRECAITPVQLVCAHIKGSGIGRGHPFMREIPVRQRRESPPTLECPFRALLFVGHGLSGGNAPVYDGSGFQPE